MARKSRIWGAVFNLGLFPLLTACALYQAGMVPDVLRGWLALSAIVFLVRSAILDSGLAR